MRFASFLPAIVLALSHGTVLARGDGTFESPLRLAVPSPTAVAAGDFNRDGKLDLAAAGQANVTVLLQDPASRLAWARVGGTLASGISFSIHAVDLDGDGDDDLVVPDLGSPGVRVLRSNGDGSFERPVVLGRCGGPREVAIGDWDQDGNLDLAAACWSDFATSVYRGAGDGTFAFLTRHATTEPPHDIEAMDYDGDGSTDILVGLPGGVLALLRRADGAFLPRSVPGAGSGRAFSVSDLNNDRRPDVITHGYDPPLVLMNLGGGSFSRVEPNLNLGGHPALADFNGDGNQDLASMTTPSGLLVYQGEGDGTFLPPVSFGFESSSSYVAAGDLDGDGHPDVVSTGTSPPALSIYWGKPGRRFLEGGHAVSGFTSPRAMGVGDLDRDGFPDLFFPDVVEEKVAVYLKAGMDSLSKVSLTIPTARVLGSLEVVDLDGDGVPDLAGASVASGVVLVALLDQRGRVRSQADLAAGLRPVGVVAGRIDEGPTPDLAAPCYGSNHVAVFLGQGGGAFAQGRYVPTVERPREVALGDLDGDGRTDLAVISQTALVLHFGTGAGVFSEPVTLVQDLWKSFSRVAIADLDRDGRGDLVVTEQRTSSALFYRGKGNRELEAPVALKVEPVPLGLWVADLDEDGFPDIVTANGASMSASVILNRGPGGFAKAVSYQLGFSPSGTRIADMDGDGALDLVAFSNTTALVLPGRVAAAIPARFRRGDADGDGAVKLNDPVAVLDHLFLGSGPLACEDAADSNDEGQVSLTDPSAPLSWLSLGGEPPAAPGPGACGEDPTADLLPGCRAACP